MPHDRAFTARAAQERQARGRKSPVTTGQLGAPLHERFDVKVQRSDGCWLWVGALYDQGYGMFSANGRPVRAHRFAYERWVGPIQDGLTIDHLCETKACVNPAHLEPVTVEENRRRYHERRGHRVAA